jgi:hypothetical protein
MTLAPANRRLFIATAMAMALMWLLGFLANLLAGAGGMVAGPADSYTNPLSLLVTAVAMAAGGWIAGKRFISVALAFMCLLWIAIVFVLFRISAPVQADALSRILSFNGLQMFLSTLAACAGAAIGAWLQIRRTAKA